jgi:ribosomal protein S14
VHCNSKLTTFTNSPSLLLLLTLPELLQPLLLLLLLSAFPSRGSPCCRTHRPVQVASKAVLLHLSRAKLREAVGDATTDGLAL